MKRIIHTILIPIIILNLSACQSGFQQDRSDPVLEESTRTLIAETKTGQVNAIELYQEFLTGNTRVDGWDIDEMATPKNEPDKRNATWYAFCDSTGDHIPELHVKAGQYYKIFTIRDNKMTVWKDLSPTHYYFPLNNGTFLRYYSESAFNQITYDYIIYNTLGDEIWSIRFYTKYGIDRTPEKTEFYFADVKVTEEQWNELTNQFLYTADDGSVVIRNEVEWVTLYE